MSRAYNMSVHISDFRPDRAAAIRAAAHAEWSFEWYGDGEQNLYGDADGCLAGGESEDEFADRVALAIWTANGACCDIEVVATYLESLPCESYLRSQEDFQRLLSKQRESPP